MLDKIVNKIDLSLIENEYLENQIRLIKTGKIDTLLYSKNLNVEINKSNALKNITYGDYHLYKKFPEDSLSLDFYKKALNTSLKIKDSILITESLKKYLINFHRIEVRTNYQPVIFQSMKNIYTIRMNLRITHFLIL